MIRKKCIIYVDDKIMLAQSGTNLDIKVSSILYPWISFGPIEQWDPDSVRIVPNGDDEVDEDEDCIIIDKVLSPSGSLYWDKNECPAVGQRFHAIVCYVNLE